MNILYGRGEKSISLFNRIAHFHGEKKVFFFDRSVVSFALNFS